MAELSDEAKAAFKRAAEAVIAAGSEDRGAVNEQVRSVIKSAKDAWPSLTEDDLANFFQSQALLMNNLAHMNVMQLSTAVDIVFRNCTMAAAACAGAYDVTDDEAPKRDLSDLAEEARKADENSEDDDPDNPRLTGMYL
jgi:phage-related protein